MTMWSGTMRMAMLFADGGGGGSDGGEWLKSRLKPRAKCI